jgi:hypothetical protein
MKRAMVLLETGVKSALALALLPGNGTSTGVVVGVSLLGMMPWFAAYRERY